jgi:hypothetical protein
MRVLWAQDCGGERLYIREKKINNIVKVMKSRRMMWARACSTHERNDKYMQTFDLKSSREERRFCLLPCDAV